MDKKIIKKIIKKFMANSLASFKPFVVLAAMFAVFTSTNSNAQSEVSASGVTFYGSPSYYTTTEGSYAIQYSSALPWGARVYLLYGFGGDYTNQLGHSESVEWADQSEVQLDASAPNTWKAIVNKTLHSRSQNRVLNSLSFVFRVELPDGKVSYDNGGASPWGFYELNVYPIRQFAPGQPYPGEKDSMGISRIERN